MPTEKAVKAARYCATSSSCRSPESTEDCYSVPSALNKQLLSVERSARTWCAPPSCLPGDWVRCLLKRGVSWAGINVSKTEGDIQDNELKKILSEGAKLQTMAAEQKLSDQQHNSATLRFRWKTGLAIGTTVLAAGGGVLPRDRYPLVLNRQRSAPRLFPLPQENTWQLYREWADPAVYNSDSARQQVNRINKNQYHHQNKFRHRRKKRTFPTKYTYTYTTKQPAMCLADSVIKKCNKVHEENRKRKKISTTLVIKVGKKPCFCPPPKWMVVEVIPPRMSSSKRKSPQNNRAVQVEPEVNSAVESQGEIYNLTSHDKKNKKGKGNTPFPEVVKRKMFDFSCIEQRDHMSLSEFFKIMGRSLRNPVASLGEEIQIVHFHNTLEVGCLPEYQREALTNVLVKVDVIINRGVQLLPGSNSLQICQYVIAPFLTLIANSIEGSKIDTDLIEDINEQLLSLTKQSIDLLTAKELSSLYDTRVPVEKDSFSERFIMKSKQVAIRYEGEDKLLHHDLDGVNTVEKEGISVVVGYDRQRQEWVEVKKSELFFYNEEQYKNKIDYAVDFNQLLDTQSAYSIIDPDYYVFYDSQGERRNYVLMGSVLVETERDMSAEPEGSYGVTVSQRLPKKIIIKTRFGWAFESESTMISDDLSTYLDGKDTGVYYSDEIGFSEIKSNGFSYGADKKKYIKYKSKYYLVSEGRGNYHRLHTGGEDEISIIRKNGFFSFSINTAYILEHQYQTVGDPMLEGENYGQCYIENKYHHKLLEHGIIAYVKPETLARLGRGVYLTSDYQLVFNSGGIFFEVSQYGKEIISLKNKNDNLEDIKLFFAGGVYIGIRENNKIVIGYEEIIPRDGCMIKRSPDSGGSCVRLFASSQLDKKLRDKAKYVPTKIRRSEVFSLQKYFPNLLSGATSGENFFYYKGRYYNAEFVSRGDKINMAGKTMLRVYYRGFFKNKNIIANIVFDEADKGIQLKTQEEYLAEKTGAAVDKIKACITNISYMEVTNLEILEDVISDSNKMKDMLILPKVIKYSPEIVDSVLIDYCKRQFFPKRIGEDFTIMSVNSINDNDPFYLRGGKELVLKNVRNIINIMDNVIKELDVFTPGVKFYIKRILSTENDYLARAFAKALKDTIIHMKGNTLKENIRIVSTNRSPLPANRDRTRLHVESHETMHFQPSLSPEERKTGTLAFATTDSSKKIYLNLDKLYFVDSEHSDSALRDKPVLDLTTVLLHEISHLDNIAWDIVYVPVENGKKIPILDARDFLLESIISGGLNDAVSFKKITEAYISGHDLYRGFIYDIKDNPEKMHFLVAKDSGLLANIYLSTSDFIAILIRDIYEKKYVKF